MTYSNRPETSPFQHRSEFDKSPGCLNNRLKANPFINNMPGTWSAPYSYSKPSPPPQNGNLYDTEPSPICNWATTWGDNTVSLCRPPYKYPQEVSCPMSRPLEPQRRIDPGMWNYYNRAKQFARVNKNGIINIIVILLIIVLVLQFISIRKK
jgi:hypothetical protein